MSQGDPNEEVAVLLRWP